MSHRPPKSPESVEIKHAGQSFLIYEWTKKATGETFWRFAYYDHKGKRRYVTRKSLADAKAEARKKARTTTRSDRATESLSIEQESLVKAFLSLNPSWEDIETLRRARSIKTISASQAAAKFLDTKAANQGPSRQNIKTLSKHLRPFAAFFKDRPLQTLNKSELDQWLANLKTSNGRAIAPRTRLNYRRTLVTFFIWCRSSEFLPDETTAAQKTEAPIVPRSVPQTLSPEEIALMVETCRPQYLPWLILAAFAGIRHDELWPDPGSAKRALHWEDIRFDEGIIEIPAATSKTNRRRIVPILGPVWPLQSLSSSGPACKGKPAHKTWRGEPSETKRLGALIGGWRRNALRDSFISYRAAIVGIGQTAMEAGNSESEAKKSYLDAKSQAQARAYFATSTAELMRNP